MVVPTDGSLDAALDAADAPAPLDAADAAVDQAPPDLATLDVPPGTAWCDLPMGADAEVRGITVPAGFCVRRYGRIAHARVMAFSPSGDLFLASPSTTGPGGTGPGIGAIAVLPDDNHDGVSDGVTEYLRVATGIGLTGSAHGLLFANQRLYYTADNGVFSVPYTPGDRRAAAGVAPTLVANLDDSERWTHTLARGADGTIYVSMGNYGTFMCPNPAPRRGSILAIGDGHAITGDMVARGFRNPMYIRCQPWGCYAAELTDDGWAAPGREKVLRFGSGQDYGYPCCYDQGLPSPANTSGVSCASVTPSLVGFPVGYTPFGHDFAPASWPAPYANGLFVGLHGQVGSWNNTGINWAPADPTTHAFSTEMATSFLGGWGHGTANEGRVADLVFAPDGRLFFTDDQQGHVYWLAPRTLRMPAR